MRLLPVCSLLAADKKQVYKYSTLQQQPPNYTLASLKATVENPRGSAEILSPKESVKGADTVLRGSEASIHTVL